jgi:UDP-glucose 4-epimerase
VLDWGAALAAHFPRFECRLASDGETPSVDLHGEDDRLAMSARRLAQDIGHVVPGDVASTAADFAEWIRRWPHYWEHAGR